MWWQVVSIFLFIAYSFKQIQSKGFDEKFVLVPRNMNYTEAIKRCKEMDRYGKKYWLPIDITETENKDIYAFLKENDIDRAWIGVHRMMDKSDEKTQQFFQEKQDGSVKPLEKGFWGPQEPNNFRKHKERCVEIRVLDKNSPTSNWNDAPCHRDNLVICTKPS